MEKYLDTNILIRIITNDHPELAEKAIQEIGEGKVIVPDYILSETIYTLTSFYGYSRSEISRLIDFFNNEIFLLNNKEIFLRALERFGDSNIEFVDCWLLEESLAKSKKLVTFDKKLKKLLNNYG